MKIKAAIIALFVFAVGLQAQGLSLTGYTRQYTGVLLQQNNEYAIIQNTFNLNLEQSKDNVAFKVNPFIYQYPKVGVTEIGLREAYLDIYFNSIDLRIGQQQIVWGKADGVFITDIVSPKDLREFLLPDFDEIRIGVTALKANYYLGDNTFELVWIPTFTPTRLPEEESIWFRLPDFPIQPVIDRSREKVTPSLGNSELFLKYSLLGSFIDFEVMAGTMWDDDPTMHVVKTIDPALQRLTGLTVYPEHHRLTLGGGSFNKTLGPIVLRGEGAYYQGKYFNTAAPTAFESVVEKNYLHYMMGVDYTLWDIHTSAQFIQRVILDYNELIDRDEYENMATFLAARDFLNETLNVSFFMYYDFNNSASLMRPMVTYDLSDGFELLLGANIFTGSEGMFGQYDDNDMIYAKIKYSF